MIQNDHGAGPTPTVITATVDELVERGRRLISPGQRRLLGITGSPGAGKTTLSAALLSGLGKQAALVEMDGFHLANEELNRLSRRDRKGAPDTFDVGGYASLLHTLRHQVSDVVYAPRFDRAIDQSIGSAVPVSRNTPLIVTEGNYLLMDDGGWEIVRPALDEVWYLDVPQHVREERLIGRHHSFGKTLAEARDWAHQVDLLNADLIEATRARADLVVECVDEVPGQCCQM